MEQAVKDGMFYERVGCRIVSLSRTAYPITERSLQHQERIYFTAVV